MAQRRIVIDFDDDGEASGADGAGGGPSGAAAAAAAAAGSQGAAGSSSNKPADLLRTIQIMRMSLKRLEQQKQQHAAAAAAVAASSGPGSGAVLDKHVTLQLQMEQLRQEIEQKNSQLQRMPKPGIARAGIPPGFGLPAAPPAHLAAGNAAAGPSHLGRSFSLPTASELAGGSTEQELQARHRQQQQAPPSRPQQPVERSGAGPSAGRAEDASGGPPAASMPEQQDAAEAADAFLLSLQAQSHVQPAQRPAVQDEPGLLRSAMQRQEQHSAAPSCDHRQGHEVASDPLAGGPPNGPLDRTEASRQPAADSPAVSRAGAASGLAQVATAQASPARKATAAALGAPGATPEAATAAAAPDPASPVHQRGALPFAQQLEPGAVAGHGAAGADAVGAEAAEEAAEGRPAALLPFGLLQALLPAERRRGAAAELASVRAQKRQALLKRQVLQQLLQDAAQAWDQLCARERQLLQQMGQEDVQAQLQQVAAALPSSAARTAGHRRRQQLAALAAAAEKRPQTAQLLTAPQAAGDGQQSIPGAPLLTDGSGADAAAACALPAVPTPEAEAAGPAVPASTAAAAEVPKQPVHGSAQRQGAAPLQGPSAPQQQAQRQPQSAAGGRKRARSRSRSESRGRRAAAPRQRRAPALTSSSSGTSSSSTSGSSSTSDSSTSGSSSTSSGTSTEAPARAAAQRRVQGRPGSAARDDPRGRSGSGGRAREAGRSGGGATAHVGERGRSRERAQPPPCPPARRSPTPDAAPFAVAAATRHGPSQQLPGSDAAAVQEQSRKPGGGPAKAAAASVAPSGGGASRQPVHVPDSVRRLFLQGLQRCCKLWHLPFSAHRIEGQMERLKHGFVCRQEMGAPFSQLLLAMQREGHLQLDMSGGSSSRWRVTAVPVSPAAAAGRVRAAAPAAARPSSRQEGGAAEVQAAQPGRKQGEGGQGKPPAAPSRSPAVQEEQQQRQQLAAPDRVAMADAREAAAPVRFSIRGSSRLSGNQGAATAKPGAAAPGSGAPPPAAQQGGPAAGASGSTPAVLPLSSSIPPWQKLAAAKATVAASSAAPAEAAPPAAATVDGGASQASAQPTEAVATQLPAPATGVLSPAAAESLQPSPAERAAAEAAAVDRGHAPVPPAAAEGGEGQHRLETRQRATQQQQQPTFPRPELQLQSKGPAARPLLAAAAAAAGSIKAAAAAVDVARTSAAFKFAAAELQQRRQAQDAAQPAVQAQQQAQQQARQPQRGEAPQAVRALLLVSSSSATGGREHVRLLITPQVAPLPAPPSRAQPSAQRVQSGSAAPPPAAPAAQAAAAGPSVVGHPRAQPASGAPPWARPAQAPKQQQQQQQQHPWRQPQHPQQQSAGQPLGRQPQAAPRQPVHPAGRASRTGDRQLSDYADLAPSNVSPSGTARGAGRHLPVFSSSDAGRPGSVAGAGRSPATLGSAPLPPWLQGARGLQAQAAPQHAALLAQLEGCLRGRSSNGTAAANSIGAFGRSGLLSAAVASAVLRREATGSGDTGGTGGGGIGTGTGPARSGTAAATGLGSKPAPLLADWPICPFELRGSCRDSACRFQMAVDWQQQQAAPAAEAANTRRPRVAPPATSQPQPKRRRVSDATVQAVALEQQLPLYAVSKQWLAGLGGGCAGAGAARSARPFASLLLAPAPLLEPHPAAPGAGCISAALRWQLLPGGGAVSGHTLRHRQQQAAAAQQQAQAEAQAGGSERYFGASAAQQGSERAQARPYWQRQYDEVLQQRPEDDEMWLSYAVRHAVEAGDGKTCALTPAVREQMLLVLKQGLERNRDSAALWPLYLHLYCQQPGCAAGMMVDTALQFAPHSYRLWLAAAEQQRQWQEAAALLQRGVLALCRPAGAEGGAAGEAASEARAEAALDLGLRLLQLLGMADQQDSRAQLVQWAGADLPSAGSLLARSKAALLAELQPHPRLLATLCCCCAYAAAHGCLPAAAQDSLGYRQPDLAELLRDWPEPPGQQQQQQQQAACRAALIAGADSLGLLGPSSDIPLHRERGLAPAQHARVLEGLRCARRAAPDALLVAQCGLLLAALRLDGFAGSAIAPGGSLLVQLVECTSGMPSSQAGSLAPPQRAALAAAQQRWQVFASWAGPEQPRGVQPAGVQQAGGQQARQHASPAVQQEQQPPAQPPAELVLLLQEAVVAAAAPAAAPHTSGSNPLLLACLQGRLHPAAAAALAAAVAGSGSAQAAPSALQLLSHWAVAYEAQDPSQAWPWPTQPLEALLAGSDAPAASSTADGQLEAAATAALQRLAAAQQHGKSSAVEPRRLPRPGTADAAAALYGCWLAALHRLLQPPAASEPRQPCRALPALRAAARAWSAGGQGMQPLGQLEAASLSLLAAAAPGAAAGEVAAAVQWALGGARRREALLWPPPRQPGWLDPLAAAALAPPAADAPCVPPPALVRQLALRLQVLLLESFLPACSPAGAAAAAAAALQAAKVAAASEAARGGQEQGPTLWRHPTLGWALPMAASALASSVPAVEPALWHQVVELAAALSPLAAAELSAAATAVHPFCLRLWQQRHHLLSKAALGAQKPATVVEETQQRGLALPPPWQHQTAAVWDAAPP